MELQILKCPACAASVNVDSNQSTFTCEYCKNTINIIKPVSISPGMESLPETEFNKYSNYLTILTQSMLAGNYTEAYNYCNKALEINPKSYEIWENKAICTLWTSTIANLEEKAGEIMTYLNASKQNNPHSPTYEETSKSIAENLFYCTYYKYNSIFPDGINNNTRYYSPNNISEIISSIRLFELCYNIYPNTNYLEYEIDIILKGKIQFVYLSNKKYENFYNARNHNFDAAGRLYNIEQKIRKVKPDYQLPQKIKTNTDYTILYVIGGVILVLFIFGLLSRC